MPARAQAQFGQCGTQFRRRTHGIDIRRIGAIVPKNFQRHVKLMVRRVARQAFDQIGNRFGLAGLPTTSARHCLRASQDACCAFEDRT